MANKNSYREYLKQEFTELIDMLAITEPQKRFMKSRWLDQLLWFEGRAERASKWSSRLRLMNVVGGVMIPALVSLSFNNPLGQKIEMGWIAFGLSQIVAIGAAIEQYFRWADKYTEYRKTAELLKSEGWKFLQLSGSYEPYPDHIQAYSTFSARVEQFIQEDVQTFIELARETADREKTQQQQQGQNSSSLSGAVSGSGTSNILLHRSNQEMASRDDSL